MLFRVTQALTSELFPHIKEKSQHLPWSQKEGKTSVFMDLCQERASMVKDVWTDTCDMRLVMWLYFLGFCTPERREDAISRVSVYLLLLCLVPV